MSLLDHYRYGKEVKFMKKFANLAVISAFVLLSVSVVSAKPPGAQLFNVYDNTDDGLDVAVDPDIGNVEFNANPGGQARLVIQTHLQGAAPNCEYRVELVRDSAVTNGGLDALGHTGSIQILGTLTTNAAGNGNAHFDVEVGDGELDTTVYGHLDFEDVSGECLEEDETGVSINEYGAAPDPTLSTPANWLE